MAAASQTEPNARSKFAVHGVLLAVKSILAKDPNAFGPSFQEVIAQHVLPDLQSPFPFLRGKACEVFPRNSTVFPFFSLLPAIMTVNPGIAGCG